MSSIIDRAFSRAYNEAAELYDNDELEKCVEKANELLADGAAPRYHRMKTWILLAYVLGDWNDANDCFVKAESLWQIVRRWHTVGEDAKVDRSLEDIQVALVELKEILEADKPPENSSEADVNAAMTENDSEAEEAKGMEEDDDPDTSEAAREAEEEQEPSIIATLRPKAQNEPVSEVVLNEGD